MPELSPHRRPHAKPKTTRDRLRAFVRRHDGQPLYRYHPTLRPAHAVIGRQPLLDPLPTTNRPKPSAKTNHDDVLPTLYDTPPLPWPRQLHLFVQLHYLRWRIDAALRRAPRPPTAATRRDYARAVAIRDLLITSNLRIVRGFIQRHRITDRSTLTSVAIEALIRSVDQYDPWSGFRFSTYATVSIARHCSRKQHDIVTSREVPLDNHDPVDRRPTFDLIDDDEATAATVRQVTEAISKLPDRRLREVIRARFGINRNRETLVQIGRRLGISKERVRQLEARAKALLRLKLKSRYDDDTIESHSRSKRAL
jgi:RNA polymerase sigma factor (sigma-70 family)